MEKVGVFFGSSTGNTETAAEMIQQQLGNAELFNVSDTGADRVSEFTNVVLGTSTWGVGDLQDDMEPFLADLSKMDLSGKRVALFGLGNQSAYSDTFCDGVGQIYEALQGKGAEFVGFTSAEGYDHDASRAADGSEFVGLLLDEENQGELTEERIQRWVEKIKGEFK